MTGQDFTRGDDRGERAGGQDVDGGEPRRVARTNVLRGRLVNHTVRRSTVVVLLHGRHQTETHRTHDGERVRAHNLRREGKRSKSVLDVDARRATTIHPCVRAR